MSNTREHDRDLKQTMMTNVNENMLIETRLTSTTNNGSIHVLYICYIFYFPLAHLKIPSPRGLGNIHTCRPTLTDDKHALSSLKRQEIPSSSPSSYSRLTKPTSNLIIKFDHVFWEMQHNREFFMFLFRIGPCFLRIS